MTTIIFGSNKMVNTNGIITFIDKLKNIKEEIFKIESMSNLKPMITVEIRDSKGLLIGKAYRSTSFVHWHENYKPIIETEGNSVKRLQLINKKTNQSVFDMIMKGKGEVEINGIFYVDGFQYPIIATKDLLKIGGIIFSNNTKIGGGTGITITPQGIGF